jgi:NAD(P)-dependent dehydrogenase (short-subunit alcohol dehydrogenase family)
MSQQLANKVILITNAASSIGFSVAKRLGAAGAAKLYLADSNPDMLEAIVKGLQARTLPSQSAQQTVQEPLMGRRTEFVGIHSDVKVSEQRKALFEKVNARI